MLPGCHPAQGKATLSAAELLSCFVLPDASEDEAEAAGFRAEGSRAHAFFRELISDDLAFDEARRPAFPSAPSLPALPLHPPETCCPARPGGQACRRRLFEWCTALRALPSAGLKDKIRLKLCRSGLSAALPALRHHRPCHVWDRWARRDGVRVGLSGQGLSPHATRAPNGPAPALTRSGDPLVTPLSTNRYQGVDESTLPETHTCTHEL